MSVRAKARTAHFQETPEMRKVLDDLRKYGLDSELEDVLAKGDAGHTAPRSEKSRRFSAETAPKSGPFSTAPRNPSAASPRFSGAKAGTRQPTSQPKAKTGPRPNLDAQDRDESKMDGAEPPRARIPGARPDIPSLAKLKMPMAKGDHEYLKGTPEEQANLLRLISEAGEFNPDEHRSMVLAMAGAAEGQNVEQSFNGAAGMLAAFDPQTPSERLVAIQMISAFTIAQKASRQVLNLSASADEMKTFSAIADRAMKTFLQLQKRYDNMKRGAEQRVTVEHVHVYEGGQAVVGNVSGTGTSAPAGPRFPTNHDSEEGGDERTL